MRHRVFISYSSQDERAADAVCAALESNGIGCWISHRDNRAGASWSEVILAAINDARVVVLVLSEHSNKSSMVAREVERAASTFGFTSSTRIETTLKRVRMTGWIAETAAEVLAAVVVAVGAEWWPTRRDCLN